MPNVLVVDDNRDSCMMLVKLIGRYGGPADCVESGVDALRYVEEKRPKLVFLDWMMPEMSGLEVLRVLRADPKFDGLPVVMFSAMSEAAFRQAAIEAGAQDFIVKGRFDEVEAAVKKYVKYAPA
jgi:chemosensory pili system protein ChpA (sensor histidine kinase/response regulator)